MRKLYSGIIAVTFCLMVVLIVVGYAMISDSLTIAGKVDVAVDHDVYIRSIDSLEPAGVEIKAITGTMMSAKVTTLGHASFTVTIVNQSNKVYIFERVIDGAETNIDGVYNGTAITYSHNGLTALQEINSNGGTLTFTLHINVPAGITTENYVLYFNFIEKTGTDILPDGSEDGTNTEPDTEVDTNTETGTDIDTDIGSGTQKPSAPAGSLHGDFLGLVEALLSDENNCLNDTNLIYDAVMESLTSSKRPEEDAPILHCHVNSISGGTMTEVAENANSKLTKNLHFVFEADPTNNNRLFIYMYYGESCTENMKGSEILVYKQVVTRGKDGIWYADGTYIGRAVVGEYFGGGKNGKDVLTINVYTWKAGSPESS